ncbi:MAG TPA: Rieske 2Fe-2S domain-containing protein [Acidimicrobiales bacterium]
MTTTEEHSASAGRDADPPVQDDPRHFGIDPGDPWPEDVPRGQDDSHWRFEDDPRAARRAERKIAFCWTLTLLASVGLAWVYAVGGQAQAEGVLWATAFLGLGVGFVLWGRDLLPNREVIASRGHHHVSPEGDRVAVAESLSRGIEPIARRPFLFKMLGAVGGALGIAALSPLLSLGPRPKDDLLHTKWGPGVRLTSEDGMPVRPDQLPVNGIMTVFPNGNIDDALSPTLLINIGNAPFKVPPERVGWNIGGLVAFSKICTHAGCPASLYNTETRQLVCPCHQSTFDVLSDCNPVFGPASRSLPQLPLAVDSDGYLVSQSDYHEPVGPGFWTRK